MKKIIFALAMVLTFSCNDDDSYCEDRYARNEESLRTYRDQFTAGQITVEEYNAFVDAHEIIEKKIDEDCQ